MGEDSSNSEDMAEDLIDAIDDVSDEDDVGDGLTKKEREIDVSRESERQRKAQELRKQLRRRQLGILTYRWPAFVLIIGGFLAITTEFLQVMIREPGVPPEVGFNTFTDALGGTVYFLVTFAVTADPTLEGLIYASPAPIAMIIAAVIALLAVALKEKED